MTDPVELARSFCEHMLAGRKPHSDGTPAHERSWQHGSNAWIGHTEAFIAALAAKGLVIVPREDVLWLRALSAAGVDNWQGIEHAIDLRDEMLAAAGGEDGKA